MMVTIAAAIGDDGGVSDPPGLPEPGQRVATTTAATAVSPNPLPTCCPGNRENARDNLRVMGGDRGYHLARQLVRGRIRNIAEGEHAHHALLVVDHGQPAHLLLLHDAQGVL